MPTYSYRCLSCDHSVEVLQKMTEAPLKNCPKCKKDSLQRGPGGGIGISFTGSGFYKTDYSPSQPTPAPQCCPCGKNKTSCE